jgi:hypothetical protein
VRIADANVGMLRATLLRSQWRWLLALLVAGLSGSALIGCAAEDQQVRNISDPTTLLPLPTQALLTPQPDPGCALEHAAIDERSLKSLGADGSPPVPASQHQTPLLGQLIKLEYERNCFQRAESQARERLLRLQVAVAKTIKAARRVTQNTNGP